MKDLIIDDFQDFVSESLIRHKSILDIITKSSESNSRINRAVAKSVSRCGCISISAHKQRIPDDTTLEEAPDVLSNQIEGQLCDSCQEVLKSEIGANLYYLAAICDALDLSLYDIISEQHDKIKTLGKYAML
jgi:hypothetical protein